MSSREAGSGFFWQVSLSVAHGSRRYLGMFCSSKNSVVWIFECINDTPRSSFWVLPKCLLVKILAVAIGNEDVGVLWCFLYFRTIHTGKWSDRPISMILVKAIRCGWVVHTWPRQDLVEGRVISWMIWVKPKLDRDLITRCFTLLLSRMFTLISPRRRVSLLVRYKCSVMVSNCSSSSGDESGARYTLAINSGQLDLYGVISTERTSMSLGFKRSRSSIGQMTRYVHENSTTSFVFPFNQIFGDVVFSVRVRRVEPSLSDNEYVQLCVRL